MSIEPQVAGRLRPSTVTIEFPRKAGPILRAAHPISYGILRLGLNALVALAAPGRPCNHRRAFHLSNRLDALAVAIVPPRGTLRRSMLFDRFRAEWVWHRDLPDPTKTPDSAILYFHGGGLISCGLNTHRRLVARIGQATGLPVFNVDYRQLPKAHVTETVEDCVDSYKWLLEQGFSADRVILAGDSAGGGLTFATALAARDRGLPRPGGIVAIAPWADYDSTRRRAHPNDRLDPMLSAAALATPVRLGLLVDGQLDPAWSPVNHDFTGLPPVLIQVGSTEVLRADAEQLAQCCDEAGVPCTMQVWDKAIHVFHAAADLLPDARQAIGEIAAFTQRLLDNDTSSARTRGRSSAA